MAHVAKDRVKETTTTTGTGALTLAGAVTGFRAFSSVMTSPSDTCFYGIQESGTPSTGEWEVGIGTYSGANTLTRTTVLASSNSNNAVNLSAGTKHVFITIPGDKQPANTGVVVTASNASIASGKLLTVSNTLTFTGTDASSVAFGAGGTVLYTTNISDTAYASSWNGDTNAPSKNAIYDKIEAMQHPGYKTGTAVWYSLAYQTGSSGQGGQDANRFNCSLFYLPNPVTISDLGVRINTSSAANNCGLAIYAHDASSRRPTGSPLAKTGNITTASTGFVSADITGADVALTPGFYWKVVWQSGTAQFKNFVAQDWTIMNWAIGSTSGSVVSTEMTSVYYSVTFDTSAWPDVTSASWTEDFTGGGNIVVLAKVA